MVSVKKSSHALNVSYLGRGQGGEAISSTQRALRGHSEARSGVRGDVDVILSVRHVSTCQQTGALRGRSMELEEGERRRELLALICPVLVHGQRSDYEMGAAR